MTISFKHICSAGTLAFSLSLTGGSASAAPGDPSGGACDGLEPSGGLYSTCIQAHSAASRVAQLRKVGANATAIGKAEAALAEAKAQYAELGGGAVPGFLLSYAECNARWNEGNTKNIYVTPGTAPGSCPAAAEADGLTNYCFLDNSGNPLNDVCVTVDLDN